MLRRVKFRDLDLIQDFFKSNWRNSVSKFSETDNWNSVKMMQIVKNDESHVHAYESSIFRWHNNKSNNQCVRVATISWVIVCSNTRMSVRFECTKATQYYTLNMQIQWKWNSIGTNRMNKIILIICYELLSHRH